MNEKPSAADLGWHTVSSRYLYQCPWFKVRCDHIARLGAPEGTYTYIEHPGSVFVVPVLKDGRVLLIKSYRYSVDDWCWEVPAGTLADCGDASPETVARKELLEETGAICDDLFLLGRFYLGNGFANHLAHFFLAKDTEQTSQSLQEPFEQIAEATAFSPSEIVNLIREGRINDGDSAFALLLAHSFFQRVVRPSEDL